MITGLPPHVPHVVEGVCCSYGHSYHIYVGTFDFEAEVAERIAHDLGARFVDTRREPFVLCECGQDLDFLPEGVETVQ